MNTVFFTINGVSYCILQDEEHTDFTIVRINGEGDNQDVVADGCLHQLAAAIVRLA